MLLALVPSSALHLCVPRPLLALRSDPFLCAFERWELSPTARYDRVNALKKALDVAVDKEQYEVAAKLRDELNAFSLDDEVAVLQANTAFYDAFTSGDLAVMEELWVSEMEDAAVCTHPGFSHIRGHAAIIDSWREIFRDAKMKITPDNVHCTMLRGGLSAVVTCTERVGTGDGENALTATNVFEKGGDGRWRMVLHQAGPVVQSG